MILQVQNITKSFPGVKALDQVSLDIYSGQVNAIVGENGAGKSTLMNIISGVYNEYDGTIFIDGKTEKFSTPKEAQEKGIAIIHQELNLIPYLTVAENIFLGREFQTGIGFVDYSRLKNESANLLKKLNLNISPETIINELRVGQQQIIEIAKALSLNARILIMDEPTSAISEQEVDVLFNLITSLKKSGVTIIYISHKLEELFRITDRVIALRDGKNVGSDKIENLKQEDIIGMMVGRSMDNFYVKEKVKIGEEALQINHMFIRHPSRSGNFLINDVSFSVNYANT
jgi:ribose transport system ATP-binding protein